MTNQQTISHLIARQPICNQALKVVGFELLYRMNSGHNAAHIENADSATIDVLLAAYNDLSINDVVGNQLAFVNFTSTLLQQKLPPIPPKQLIIELLEDQPVTPELLRALRALRKKGYRIALDDFCLNHETVALIDCADIIKLDVLDQSPESWKEYIPNLTDRGIIMLAEKVETYEVYERCKALGFKLFQGYFFAKPKLLSGKKMTSNQTSVLNLISKVNAQQVNFAEVTDILTADVGLSYNLLRTVNSGMYPITVKVNSVKQAAVLLGLEHLRCWINFLALSSLEDKPQVLLDAAITRARVCELIGEIITKEKQPEGFFTVGLFSMIDAFFDMTMNDLLKKLSLDVEITQALLERKGILGDILQSVIRLQEGNLDSQYSNALLKPYKISDETISLLLLETIEWVRENFPSAS